MDPGTIDFWGLRIKKTLSPPAPKESRHDENGPPIIHSTPPYLASDNIDPPQLSVVSPSSGAAWRVNVVYRQKWPKCRARVIQSQRKG